MNSSNPCKILFISPCWPFGEAFGGRLRALNIARALKQVGRVTLAVVSSDSCATEIIEQARDEFDIIAPVRVLSAPNTRPLQKLHWALNPRYLNVHGCVASFEDQSRFRQYINNFHLIWILNFRTPNILNIWHWPNSVLDVDDIPSTVDRGIWRNGASYNICLKARARMLLMKNRERSLVNRFTALAVCSQADKAYLGGGDQIHVIPNGFQRPMKVPMRDPVSPPRLGFIGLYSHQPNLEGIRWFLYHCWPRIKQAIPDIRLRLVGKDTDSELKPKESGVDSLGWVANPEAEISTWSAMIVPIQFGGGTRIKIADAFSRKCPVVSTSLGAFGYEVEDGKHLSLADSADEFAEACLELVLNPVKAQEMAERAWCKFLQEWTWEAITPKVMSAAEHCLRKNSAYTQSAPHRGAFILCGRN